MVVFPGGGKIRERRDAALASGSGLSCLMQFMDALTIDSDAACYKGYGRHIDNSYLAKCTHAILQTEPLREALRHTACGSPIVWWHRVNTGGVRGVGHL